MQRPYHARGPHDTGLTCSYISWSGGFLGGRSQSIRLSSVSIFPSFTSAFLLGSPCRHEALPLVDRPGSRLYRESGSCPMRFAFWAQGYAYGYFPLGIYRTPSRVSSPPPRSGWTCRLAR
ncbi:hypothetical protein LIER_32296 [Lithospermum erythrorhizon]|uniref:Uncharacterized protein n=1 Tax=Lithospermum erythrorhizon TaxID=34254 RepID=A0AAV3RTG2_LITER